MASDELTLEIEPDMSKPQKVRLPAFVSLTLRARLKSQAAAARMPFAKYLECLLEDAANLQDEKLGGSEP